MKFLLDIPKLIEAGREIYNVIEEIKEDKEKNKPQAPVEDAKPVDDCSASKEEIELPEAMIPDDDFKDPQ